MSARIVRVNRDLAEHLESYRHACQRLLLLESPAPQGTVSVFWKVSVDLVGSFRVMGSFCARTPGEVAQHAHTTD